MSQRALILLSALLTASVLVLVGAVAGRLGGTSERSSGPAAAPVPTAAEPAADPSPPAAEPAATDATNPSRPADRLDDDDRPDWLAARGEHARPHPRTVRRHHEDDDDD
jgi:pyruvate/2-oxoglutarate dehydrogenase complex dihydrolipoamide acyltransferase (E2) component